MSDQLKLEGEGFEPTRSPTSVMGGLIKDIYLEPLRQVLNSSQFLLGSEYVSPIMPLFEREPTCFATHEIGEDFLNCYLGKGHHGPHYDAYARVEWLAK